MMMLLRFPVRHHQLSYKWQPSVAPDCFPFHDDDDSDYDQDDDDQGDDDQGDDGHDGRSRLRCSYPWARRLRTRERAGRTPPDEDDDDDE